MRLWNEEAPEAHCWRRGRLYSKVWQPFASGAAFKWVPYERVGPWLTDIIPPVAPVGEADEARRETGFVEDAWMPIAKVTLAGTRKS